MAKGYRISFDHKGEQKILMVATANADAAQAKVVADYPGATGLVILPFRAGDFDRYGMHEGQVIESKDIGR